jgi:hypothetical protein
MLSEVCHLLLLLLLHQASDHGSSSLSHLVSIFVERSHTLWRTQDVQAWLKTAAEVAADMAGELPVNFFRRCMHMFVHHL